MSRVTSATGGVLPITTSLATGGPSSSPSVGLRITFQTSPFFVSVAATSMPVRSKRLAPSTNQRVL